MKSILWNDKYWDIISNLYWTPRFLGLKSISIESWHIAPGQFSIPISEISKETDRVYWRKLKLPVLRNYLKRQEEILNHLFNLTFSIAADEVVSKLLCEPLGIDDIGPFSSFGREIKELYNFGEGFTQPDGFFVTDNSAICIELKLASRSWPAQIAKYVALLANEESRRAKRLNVGLMFIVPETSLKDHWKNVGLIGSEISSEFLENLDQSELNKKMQKFFEENRMQIADILDRLKLVAVSWTAFRNEILRIETKLDCSRPGDQTLNRLLAGFMAQIDAHEGTGIPKPVVI